MTHLLPQPYLLTPWNGVPLEKLTGSAASEEIPRILLTQFLYKTSELMDCGIEV
jgi:hypothetical protein